MTPTIFIKYSMQKIAGAISRFRKDFHFWKNYQKNTEQDSMIQALYN